MSQMGDRVERISVIVPMLNESEHVEVLVEDLAAQDFEGGVKVLVADGGSTDGSRERLAAAAERAGLDVVILDNPARWASPGLNACLRQADGDLIVRLDCHSRYPSDYLRRSANASEETGAWAVGGLLEPIGRTETERAVACALESPFGGHNWAPYKGGPARVDADTVSYGGAIRPEVFERVGTYDESLPVGEVEDLNLRILKAGGRVVYDPSIRPLYVPRSSFTAQARQYYRYGLWKVAVMVKHRQVVTARSQVPSLFVLSLVLAAAAAPRSRLARRLLAAEVTLYAATATVAGAVTIRNRREPWSLLPRVVALFPTMHVAYGLGSFHGWARAARRRRR
jgi:glycosyltransferase involved in cell wall biosynthesis